MMKNGRITLEKNVTMDYVAFGRGTRPLVILSGLGDVLRGVKGTALPMSILYRAFSKDFRVYLFSRKDPLLPSRTTRDFARDQKAAMDRLGISKADVVGVSQGGMIAQFLAIDYPEAVGKLVLCATCPQPNPTLETAVALWMRMARRGDAMSLMRDNVERIYSPRYVKRLGWLAPIVGLLTAPSSFHRFLVMAQACLDHNALEELPRITAPTLIIGGEQDRVLTGLASYELANKIPGSRLVMYPDLGHSVYEEAPDFQSRVLEFLLEP
jgi:pimeloyl-ACP methyl ester carboxylesterase